MVRGRLRTERSRLDVAAFTSCGFEFEMVEEDDALVLAASAPLSAFPPAFESRISEALLFVLGALPLWSVIQIHAGGLTKTKIRAAETEDLKKHRHVPIRFGVADETQQVWRLFDLYLQYITRDEGTPAHLHLLSTQVWAVARTCDASVEARALTLAVAVETLLSEYFSDIAQPPPDHVARVDDLLNHVRQWNGDTVTRDRALGAIGSIKGTRPGDKLRELEGKGLTTPGNRNAWTDLRNAAAHGDWSAVRQDLQAFIDRIEQVRVLFYRLIFAIIGYEGKYTDWGTRGWPFVVFPPGSVTLPSNSGPVPDNKEGPNNA